MVALAVLVVAGSRRLVLAGQHLRQRKVMRVGMVAVLAVLAAVAAVVLVR
jgi:hypothetical protein